MPTYAELVNADSIKVDDVVGLTVAAPTFSNGCKTDTISEETAAAGVTIDGVLLKDSRIATSVLEFNMTSWTPTVTASGAMTVSAVAVNFAKWGDLGSAIYVVANVIFTLGGTASTDVYLTVPVNIQNIGAPLSMHTNESSNSVTSIGEVYSATQVVARRPSYANWTLGTLRSVSFCGIIQRA
jgi:hypothetical protein